MQRRDLRLVGQRQHVGFAPLPARRRERIKAFVIGERGFAAVRIGFYRDVAVFQRRFEAVAQEGQRQAARPVDIEIARIAALLAVLNHIAPPGVLQRGGHMVRHDIDDQLEARLLQRLHQPVETGAAADGGIDGVGVGHVVAVGRAAGGGKDRRGVEVGDAEPFNIGHQRRRAIEGHAVAKLNTVGGGWNGHWASPLARRTTMAFCGRSRLFSGQAKIVSPGCSGSGCLLSPIFSASDSVPAGKRQLT